MAVDICVLYLTKSASDFQQSQYYSAYEMADYSVFYLFLTLKVSFPFSTSGK